MKSIVKKSLVAAVALIGAFAITTGVVHAYNQAEYTGNGQPQFNAYSDVQNYGNEHDFFRVGPVNGRGSEFSNNFNVCEGNAQFNTYVHNSAPEGYNGTNNNGTGVATNTKLQINLPTGSAKEQNAEAVISASNAPTVKDGATINCGDHEVKIEYVANSATVYGNHIPGGSQKLSNEVVNGGTLVGSYANDGVVPGCWDFRVYVTIEVKVTKVTKETPAYQCKVTDVVVNDEQLRKVTATVNGSATNGAEVVGYELNFGDGTVVAEQSAMHEYAANGSYAITGRVQVKLPNGDVVWADGAECVKEVTFDGETPVTPETPTTLPSTGVGSLAGIFTAVSAAGAVAHNAISRRRNV